VLDPAGILLAVGMNVSVRPRAVFDGCIDLGTDGAACAEPQPLVAGGGCDAAGAPPPSGPWLAAALAGLLAASARRRRVIGWRVASPRRVPGFRLRRDFPRW